MVAEPSLDFLPRVSAWTEDDAKKTKTHASELNVDGVTTRDLVGLESGYVELLVEVVLGGLFSRTIAVGIKSVLPGEEAHE